MDGAVNLEPLKFLSENEDIQPVLMVLNQGIDEELHIFKRIWKKAVLKVFVDGGCNEVYKSHGEDRFKYIPDYITGDFDSVQQHILEYYKNKGANVFNTPDQNATDFTKGLRKVLELSTNQKYDSILVMNSFGGRLDHVFANVNTLYEVQPLTNAPIYCISQGNLACLIQKGKTVIKIKNEHKKGTCGLIPVGQPANRVTTTGLKWNLDNQRMKFAELISTSNTYDGSGDDITVETDEPLLWTMQYFIP